MMKLNITPHLLSILFIAFLGCARQQPAKILTPSEAHQKLVDILREENGIKVTTQEFENTFWIYLPFEKSFFRMKAKKQRSPRSSEASAPPTIHFLEAEFKNSNFEINYDIGSSKIYAKDPGYTSTFSEEYQAKQRNILTAISRAYTDVEETPQMFVIVIADIINGLESRVIFHFNDLKRAYTDQTFHIEYAKRVISEQPTGNPAIVGDKEGKYLKLYDITLPEFLAKQIIFRINFKYTRSAFPPTGGPKEEILKAAADTLAAYDFTDFASIQLHDLSDGAIDTIGSEELAGYQDPPSEGRLIHIKFR